MDSGFRSARSQFTKFTMARQSKYDEHFRRNAVALVESGRTASSVARELGIHVNHLYDWLKVYRTKPSSRQVSPDRDVELERLQKAYDQLKTEHEILKKAVAIFSRPPK
jgi:transposase